MTKHLEFKEMTPICPLCTKPMKKVRWQLSYNPNENNKAYDNTLYACAQDDVWVTMESPQLHQSTST